ncbi:MAG: response regulator [Pirellulaceae bacterium]
MHEVIHVLQIEDSPLVVKLTHSMLAESKGISFELESVESLAQGIERAARGGIDVVLLDLTLPDSQGLETFHALHSTFAKLPVVIYTNLDDEELSLRALRQGAADYLVKSEVHSKWLARSLCYAWHRSRLKSADGKPSKSESRPQSQVMEVEKSRTSPGTFEVRINERRMVSVVTMEAVKDRLLKLVRREDCAEVRINFAKVIYVANAAIAALLIVNKQAKSTGKPLVFTNVSPQVYEQFSSRRFDKVFQIEPADSGTRA